MQSYVNTQKIPEKAHNTDLEALWKYEMKAKAELPTWLNIEGMLQHTRGVPWRM